MTERSPSRPYVDHVPALGADGEPLGTGRLLRGAAAAGKGVARERGFAAVDPQAQTHALGFCERLGYVAYGPEFDDAGMPHRAMRRGV